MGKDHSGETGAKPVDARVARRRQDAIGRRLRQMYDDVVNEDVPDDFMLLLEQADEGPDPDDPKKNLAANGGETDAAVRVGRTVKTEP